MDLQPFSIVEDAAFRKFVRALNAAYELPNRKTISNSLIPALYEECKNRVMESMKDILKISLTTDCWTSINNDSFMAVTVHFIDRKFQMKSILLECAILYGGHTSDNLASELERIVKYWGLDKKIVAAVSDNAANIKCAITGLGWKHFGCFAHTLNLVVQNALEIVDDTLDKVKRIVAHFKKSTNSNSLLLTTQRQFGINIPKKLIQSVPTRWNSTFYMIERFVELEEVLKATIPRCRLSSSSTLPQIDTDEWTILKEMCKILHPFEDATKSVSGEKYASASLVIVLTNGLVNVCNVLAAETLEETSLKLVKALKTGLQTRLVNVEYSNTLAVCTLLDPRFKTFCFQNNDAVEKVKKNVTESLTTIINKAVNQSRSRSTQETEVDDNRGQTASLTIAPEKRLSASAWDLLQQSLAQHQPRFSASARAIMEFQRYLEDEVLDKHQNPLEWWKMNEHNYPYLSQVVRRMCCVLATSVPCERLFSKAGRILEERRTRLSAKKLEYLLFLNTNIHILECND